MTSKQRAALRALAGKIEPCFQIGKGNISESQLIGIGEALEKRELIKVDILKSCELTPEEALRSLAARLKAEPVCAIGYKIVLYRRSKSDKIKHIEF